MLKIALPILLITFSVNVMASAAVLVSDGADVPADQATITNDAIQQATLNAQIAQDTVNMDSALDEINNIGNTDVDTQTASYHVGSSSSSKDTSSDADRQDNTIYVDTSSNTTPDKSTSKDDSTKDQQAAKDTSKSKADAKDADKTNNEEKTVTIKAKPQPDPNAVTFTATENSLEKNINSWAKKYGYQVVWDVSNTDNDDPADYQWIGNETIHGATSTEVLKQLVDGYPVNTTVWNQNNVICVDNNKQCTKEAAK